ncbi:Nn.00g009380.m01.CDS01 [Neocucurbitaria sp. VM-36]
MASTSDKQIILITGATNGIGLDSAIHLANASPNNHIIIGARNLSKGSKVLQELQAKNPKGTLSLLHLDTTSDSSIHSAAHQLEQDFPRLDVLVNNAGICPETPDAPWPTRSTLRSTFETNVFGPTILTAALTPLLQRSPAPKIINVSSALGSIAALSDHAGAFSSVPYPAYRMSKAALNMLTAYQYFHLKEFGCKVWTYCPGYVVTDLGRDREKREELGMESSETSAVGVVEIVEGKRDGEVGGFIGRRGLRHEW